MVGIANRELYARAKWKGISARVEYTRKALFRLQLYGERATKLSDLVRHSRTRAHGPCVSWFKESSGAVFGVHDEWHQVPTDLLERAG